MVAVVIKSIFILTGELLVCASVTDGGQEVKW